MMFDTNIRIWCCILLFASVHAVLPAQSMSGMTGLLTIPSADMQQDKTVFFGGSFLNEQLTPSAFSYHTFNYYLNVTILPFLEVGYSCTMFKASEKFIPQKAGKFVNQDRALSVRVRPLKEGKYYPSIVIGSNDINKTQFLSSKTGNTFFNSIYVVASKYFPIGTEQIGTHLAYTYSKRKDARVKDFSLGATYAPSFLPDLTLIAEGTRNDLNIGASYLFFNHLFAQCILQRGCYFSGGVGYKIYLK